jgi:hypothetical protein
MKTPAWIPLVALLALGGCSDDDPISQQQLYAHTRVLNATPVAAHGNAQMFADEERVGTVFQFGTPTGCNSLTVAEGTRSISFRTAAGDVIAETDYTFVSGIDYIIALLPDPAVVDGSRVAIYPEAYPSTVTAQMNAVRVINATIFGGDVVFTTPTGVVTTTSPARIALPAGASTTAAEFREVPVNEVRIRLFNTGEVTSAIADYTLTAVPTERIVTAFLTDSTFSRPSMGVQLNRCVH